MEGIYGWVKNIIYYMIFLSVVNNLLAESKYEKYVRFFAGMVLILLVASPFTGSLRLDEQISALFQAISFQNDTEDFKTELWGMEDKRLEQIIGKYEEAVENDVAAMAQAEGISCASVRVSIDADRESSRYGQVKEISLVLERKEAQERGEDPKGIHPVNVGNEKVESIMIEPVEIQEDSESTADKAGENEGAGMSGVLPRNCENAVELKHLTGKVAQYYGLEETGVEVQWKDE